MSRILEKLRNSHNKGKILEEVVVDIFKSKSLNNVQRQKGGSQYGFDVIGFKEGMCWKAECKNLKDKVSIEQLAPKLIWHLDGKNIDKFIIVSIYGLSNDVRKLIEESSFAFDIEIWFGKFLEHSILNCPRAMERIGISCEKESRDDKIEPLFYPKVKVQFNVFYSQSTPRSFDYIIIDDNLIRSFTEEEFKLSCLVSNPLKSDIYIQEMNVITIKYVNTDNYRIFRQRTMRGYFEPVEFKIKPKIQLSGQVNITGSSMLKLEKGESELVTLTLGHL